VTSRSRGQGKDRPRKRATDKRPVTDKVRILFDLDLLPPLNDAGLRAIAAASALERVKSYPQPEGMSFEIWSRQLELCQADMDAAQAAKDAAQAAVDEETFEVVLRAMPPKQYFELAAEHPPTEEQVAKAEEMADLAGLYEGKTETQRRQMKIDFNPETFPRAIVRACATELDEDEIEAIFDPEGTWAPGDKDELFNRSLAVCQRASILKR